MSADNSIETLVTDHFENARQILEAIAEQSSHPRGSTHDGLPQYLGISGRKAYQEYIYSKFSDVINMPSFDYISKVTSGWLLVGDHRAEIQARVALIIECHGIGVGMMALHAQQMNAQHIPLEITLDGKLEVLAKPTERLYGARGEHVLYVPVRKYRSDFGKLAELNIVKPKNLWKPSNIVSHEYDRFPCFYCSSAEINPSEVVVDIKGNRFGFSRDYSLGYTFAPFGDSSEVMHFLAWDRSENPLNMNRTPMTVTDLVEMVRSINISINNYFAGTEVADYPVITGVSNGWAGNSIYHQHFQFFQPEYHSPIESPNLVVRKPLLERDDVLVHKLSWNSPVYKIATEDAINVGLVGNDMAGIWRLLGRVKKIEYKEFPDGYEVQGEERVPVHTQNIYVPGSEFGRTAYVLLRDRRFVNYTPDESDYINQRRKFRAEQKENIGVLEVSGTMIIDDLESFRVMGKWDPKDVSAQIDRVTCAICPERDKVNKFEKSIQELFPQ